MRKKLQRMEGKRAEFVAEVVRYGTSSGRWAAPTLLLKDVRRAGSGAVVTDHLWLKVGKRLAALGGLPPGTLLHFEARVKCYYKQPYVEFGDRTHERDYKLAWPTAFRVE